MFNYYNLSFEEKASLETEIRFIVATAAVEGLELLALAFPIESEAEGKKNETLLKRSLNTLKREGKITFYKNLDLLDDGSTESEFLKNKYSSYLSARGKDTVYFVKI